MSAATPPMPSHTAAMGEDTDILDDLLILMEGNGDISEATRNQIMAKALREMIKRTRKIERESIVGLLRRNPVRVIAITTAGFVLMHEFATYINVGVLLAAVAKMLGIPLP